MAGLMSDSTTQHDVHHDRVWVRTVPYSSPACTSTHPCPCRRRSKQAQGRACSRAGRGLAAGGVGCLTFISRPLHLGAHCAHGLCSAVWPRVRRLCSLCPVPGWDLASPPALAPPIPIYRPAASLRRCVAAHCPLPAARCPPPTPSHSLASLSTRLPTSLALRVKLRRPRYCTTTQPSSPSSPSLLARTLPRPRPSTCPCRMPQIGPGSIRKTRRL
jgi:hypothetical protein